MDNIQLEILNDAVRQANDMGKNGVRVVSVEWLPPKTGADDIHGTIIFICDHGPTTGSES